VGLFTGPLRKRARGHFEGLALLREADANSLGVESRGPWQVRGNGNLALTDEELLFAQWVPNRVVRIPRELILEVTMTRSHLGKTIGRDLLKVVWANEAGERDSIALAVEDTDRWVAELSA
jgi:hypothetical protein